MIYPTAAGDVAVKSSIMASMESKLTNEELLKQWQSCIHAHNQLHNKSETIWDDLADQKKSRYAEQVMQMQSLWSQK